MAAGRAAVAAVLVDDALEVGPDGLRARQQVVQAGGVHREVRHVVAAGDQRPVEVRERGDEVVEEGGGFGVVDVGHRQGSGTGNPPSWRARGRQHCCRHGITYARPPAPRLRPAVTTAVTTRRLARWGDAGANGQRYRWTRALWMRSGEQCGGSRAAGRAVPTRGRQPGSPRALGGQRNARGPPRTRRDAPGGRRLPRDRRGGGPRRGDDAGCRRFARRPHDLARFDRGASRRGCAARSSFSAVLRRCCSQSADLASERVLRSMAADDRG